MEKDVEEDVRVAAAKSLAGLGICQAGPYLLRQPNTDLVGECIRVLGSAKPDDIGAKCCRLLLHDSGPYWQISRFLKQEIRHLNAAIYPEYNHWVKHAVEGIPHIYRSLGWLGRIDAWLILKRLSLKTRFPRNLYCSEAKDALQQIMLH